MASTLKEDVGNLLSTQIYPTTESQTPARLPWFFLPDRNTDGHTLVTDSKKYDHIFTCFS